MDIGEDGIRMGESPTLGPVSVTIGSRVVPLKGRQDPILTELRAIRASLENIEAKLTRAPWWVRAWRRIKSWVA